MRMTNKSWEEAACGAIERHLFKMMYLNDFEKRKYEDEEAKTIWRCMLDKFVEDYQTFPQEKKEWLIEKLKEDFSEEQWLLLQSEYDKLMTPITTSGYALREYKPRKTKPIKRKKVWRLF